MVHEAACSIAAAAVSLGERGDEPTRAAWQG